MRRRRVLRRLITNVCIVCNLGRPAARPLTQIAFDGGLELPDYAPEQELFVRNIRPLSRTSGGTASASPRWSILTQLLNRLSYHFFHRFSSLSRAIRPTSMDALGGPESKSQTHDDSAVIQWWNVLGNSCRCCQKRPVERCCDVTPKKPVASSVGRTLPARESVSAPTENKAGHSLDERLGGIEQGVHGKFLGNHVAERIAQVRATHIGLVNVI